MSSDFEDGIDWDEAVITLKAAESATSGTTTAVNKFTGHVEEEAYDPELLILYDLLSKEDADIEECGMAGTGQRAAKTLFDQFRRKRGYLSVTDLTAPGGWCEVQYTYSLLGRRDLKPEARPDVIVTAAGNEIKVDKKIAVAHEKVLQKGREVHKVLELEVHPEQTIIKTESKADRWGLRLLNQIISLATLLETGKAREIPIFGFVGELFVVGVMDEIERRTLSTDNAPPELSQRGTLLNYFQTSSPTKTAPEVGYFLVDSKTRRSPHMPNELYTGASRFQLMLYKHLFDMHATASFDWQRFYNHIDMPSDTKFSDSFIEQTTNLAILLDSDGVATATTLGEMAKALCDYHLRVDALEDSLELVYRWRGHADAKSKRSVKRKSKVVRSDDKATTVVEPSSQSVHDAAQSPSTSGTPSANLTQQDFPSKPGDIREVPIDLTSDSSNTPPAPDSSSSDVDMDCSSGPDPTTPRRIRQRDSPVLHSEAPSHSVGDTDSSASSPSSTSLNLQEIAKKAKAVSQRALGSIIGVEQFEYNDAALQRYLEGAVSFWLGRPPQGVAIHEVNKCRNCEFQDGCEWLAAKAEEHRNLVALRKLTKQK